MAVDMPPTARTSYPNVVLPVEAISPPAQQEYSEVKICLENCIIPQTRVATTPSSEDGIDQLLEFSLRRYGCDLIQLAGHLLKLPQIAMATAQILYQRFFYSRSFLKHYYQRVAMACVLLSSKVEEAPRRPRDVINTFHYVKQVRFLNEIPTPVVLDAEYLRVKTDVIECERRLLKELGFCVRVQHPHKLISVYVRILLAGTPLEIKNNDENPFLQNAWNYMNDSLRTDLFVRYTPEHIACACISLALRDQSDVALPQFPHHWAEAFGVGRAELELMCREIRALYEIKPPSMKVVDDNIEHARTAYEKRRHEQILSSALAVAQAKVGELTMAYSPVTDSAAAGVQATTTKIPVGQQCRDKRRNDDWNASHSNEHRSRSRHQHSSHAHSHERHRYRKSYDEERSRR